jgi:hypothetical protein
MSESQKTSVRSEIASTIPSFKICWMIQPRTGGALRLSQKPFRPGIRHIHCPNDSLGLDQTPVAPLKMDERRTVPPVNDKVMRHKWRDAIERFRKKFALFQVRRISRGHDGKRSIRSLGGT